MHSFIRDLLEDNDTIKIEDGELSLTANQFNVVRHHTFIEVEAEISGTYDGTPIKGTYVYAAAGATPRTEYYGTMDQDGDDDAPIYKAISTNTEVKKKIESMINDVSDHDGIDDGDDGDDAGDDVGEESDDGLISDTVPDEN